MKPIRVLVVAPDADLRDSLCFALGTHGYVVSSSPTFDPSAEDGKYDCIVLHEKARELEATMPLPDELLLLTYSAGESTMAAKHVLQMPILGNDLIDAVSALISPQ